MSGFSSFDVSLLLKGALVTVLLTLGGGLCGMAGAIVLVACRETQNLFCAPLRSLAAAYMQIVRRIPFIVTLYVVFFLTGIARIDLSGIAVGIVAIGLIAAAYLGEIVRGGLRSVPIEQIEAAMTLNLPTIARWRHVILPKALPAIVPPAVAYLVLFIKDTALASQVGVIELNQAGVILTNRGLPPVNVFLVVLCLYWIISYPLTRLSRLMERRLALS